MVAICPAHERLMLGREGDPGFEHAVRELGRHIRLDRPGFARYLAEHDVVASASRLKAQALLLVHCKGDEVVPYQLSQLVYDATMEPKTLWLIDGGSHTSAQHDPELQIQVINWLEDHLLT